MGLGVPEDPNIATFAPTGTTDLTSSRSLAAQIENMGLPAVVAASPVKAVRPNGSEAWMVRLAYTSEEVPHPVAALPNARPVSWELKTTSNKEQARAWIKLGIFSALMWTGIAVAGGTAIWWAVSSATGDRSPSSE